MKVRIVSTDSGTGDNWQCDVEVQGVTGHTVLDAYKANLAAEIGCPVDEIGDHTLRAWVPNGDEFAFVASTNEACFGEILSHTCYNNFLIEAWEGWNEVCEPDQQMDNPWGTP